MRGVLLTLMIAPPAVGLLAMFLLRIQLRRFRREVPVVRTEGDIVLLKRLAAVQMYAALLLLPLTALPPLAWLYGVFIAGVLGWLDLMLYVMLPLAAFVVGACVTSSPAKEVQVMPVVNASLEAERDHIVEVWLHRMLPD